MGGAGAGGWTASGAPRRSGLIRTPILVNPTRAISVRRAALLVLLVAVGTYANSVLNGFAYDDNTIIAGHPVVTEGRVVDALSSSYWPQTVDQVNSAADG